MTLITIAIVTLSAAVLNGIAVAAILQRTEATKRPVLVPVPVSRNPTRPLESMLCTVVEPAPRYAAPVRRGAPALCWGEVGLYADQHAAQLFHQLRQA